MLSLPGYSLTTASFNVCMHVLQIADPVAFIRDQASRNIPEIFLASSDAHYSGETNDVSAISLLEKNPTKLCARPERSSQNAFFEKNLITRISNSTRIYLLCQTCGVVVVGWLFAERPSNMLVKSVRGAKCLKRIWTPWKDIPQETGMPRVKGLRMTML